MKKFRVLVTRTIPDEGIQLLQADSRIKLSIYNKDKVMPRAMLLRRAKGQNAILSILTDKMNSEVFDAAGPSLRVIANYAVGFDNIDLIEAKKRGITVTNTPHDLVNEAVAEHTIALIFALMRRIVESDAYTRKGKYKAWSPQLLMGSSLFGKTVGIIGTGRIGTAVVQRLYEGFGVKILYTDVKPSQELEQKINAQYRSKEDLLRESDVVSLHVPLLPSTRHLISTAEFALMKPTAFLINTARGPVVDEKALLIALTNKQIAGAGLDVFECEPAIDCDLTDTLELRKMPNVVLTPHTASATIEARQAMSRVAAENILAFLDGKVPPHAVKS